jgi:LysM repeat protein
MVTKKVASKKKVAVVAEVKPEPPAELTLEQHIVRRVKAGHSLENIAEQHGVTVEHVKKLAKIG